MPPPEPKKAIAKRKPPTRKIEPETVPTVAENKTEGITFGYKNPYSTMFGHTTTNVNAMRQKLALRF